jgi:hypothetical protein
VHCFFLCIWAIPPALCYSARLAEAADVFRNILGYHFWNLQLVGKLYAEAMLKHQKFSAKLI